MNAVNHWFVRWQVRGLLVLGRREAALEQLDLMLLADPSDVYALATRAHVLAEQGNKPGALQALQRLVELQPDRSAPWFNLGFLSEEMGQLEEAEAAFRRATEIDLITRYLADPLCRCLTLVGPGGMGKTRKRRRSSPSRSFRVRLTALQVCQIPRSFSRMAGRAPRTRACSCSSAGKVCAAAGTDAGAGVVCATLSPPVWAHRARCRETRRAGGCA